MTRWALAAALFLLCAPADALFLKSQMDRIDTEAESREVGCRAWAGLCAEIARCNSGAGGGF